MTAAEWVRVLYIFDGRCAYCGRLPDARTGELLTKDCMVPVARNGLYLAFNVVPACRYCNTSKANRNVVDWMLSKGRERQLDLLIERMDELWRAYLTW